MRDEHLECAARILLLEQRGEPMGRQFVLRILRGQPAPRRDRAPGVPRLLGQLTEAAQRGLRVLASLGEVHVRGKPLLERQRQLIFDLRRNGHPTADAEQLLRTFQDSLHELRKMLFTLQNRVRRGL